MDTFYGFKLGQTQDYDSTGRRWPVTMVRVEPLTAINSRQVVFGTKKHLSKPLQGLLRQAQDKSSKTPQTISPKYIREIKYQADELDKFSPGTKIAVSEIFNPGDKVKVTGISKGKGFAGVIKRHGFHGGPKTHGQSTKARHPGAIASGTTPGRVYKGKKMAGHMGNAQVTTSGLEVFAVKPEENLLLIRGLVPGGKNGLLKITKT